MGATSVADAILQSEASLVAKQEAARLVESWQTNVLAYDLEYYTLGTEVVFGVWLDERTILVGLLDRVWRGGDMIGASEWKTTTPSRYWTAEAWLEDIRRSSQIPLYGLGLKRGYWLRNGHLGVPVPAETSTPALIQIRAITKTEPPQFWPEEEPCFFEVKPPDMDRAVGALINRAEAIRAVRRTGRTPWQLTGKHCRSFGKDCEYLERFCQAESLPPAEWQSSEDSGIALLIEQMYEQAGRKRDDELVVLSNTSYDWGARCMEYLRLKKQLREKEEAYAFEVGRAFHAGLAALYTQKRTERA